MEKLQIIKSKCKNQKTTILNPGQWGLHIKNRYIILQSPKSRTLGGAHTKLIHFHPLFPLWQLPTPFWIQLVCTSHGMRPMLLKLELAHISTPSVDNSQEIIFLTKQDKSWLGHQEVSQRWRGRKKSLRCKRTKVSGRCKRSKGFRTTQTSPSSSKSANIPWFSSANLLYESKIHTRIKVFRRCKHTKVSPKNSPKMQADQPFPMMHR